MSNRLNSRNQFLLFHCKVRSLLPDECGHSLTIRNSVVAIKRWTEILLPLIIYYHCSSQSWALSKFILFKFKKYIYIYIYIYYPTLILLFMNNVIHILHNCAVIVVVVFWADVSYCDKQTQTTETSEYVAGNFSFTLIKRDFFKMLLWK